MKARVSNFGIAPREYECVYPWDCFCQGGDGGIVFSKKGNYRTAFFEAFPDNPVSCFIRGEGEDIPAAEKSAWEKLESIKKCHPDHEMERRGHTDGYAYCKKCTYSSTVFEPLTKCCKCGKPTNWTPDYRGKWYCREHARHIPKDPNFKVNISHRSGKIPRKLKKKLVALARIKLGLYGKSTGGKNRVKLSGLYNDYFLHIDSGKSANIYFLKRMLRNGTK